MFMNICNIKQKKSLIYVLSFLIIFFVNLLLILFKLNTNCCDCFEVLLIRSCWRFTTNLCFSFFKCCKTINRLSTSTLVSHTLQNKIIPSVEKIFFQNSDIYWFILPFLNTQINYTKKKVQLIRNNVNVIWLTNGHVQLFISSYDLYPANNWWLGSLNLYLFDDKSVGEV